MIAAEGPGPAGAVLIPPRPNLGPEPMPEARSNAGLALTLLTLIAGLVVGGLLLRFGLRRRSPGPGPVSLSPWPEDPSGSPRDRLIAGSRAVREALAARLGPAWLARTTEELAADPALAGLIGDESVARLVAFLRAADRAKFAPDDDPGPEPPGDQSAWLVALVESLRAAAGARSRIRGK